MSLTFGSLFAGIGGIDLGLERAGMECRWQVEIDDYAIQVLTKHWPKVYRQRDVRECGLHNLERVDVIAAGFPCQDISYAGDGAGLKGKRSGLFYEASRIICELEPRFVLLENVPALLTRGIGDVLGALASIGYDAEWHCIPASYVGAPHRRDRIWIVAYSRHWGGGNIRVAQGGEDTQSQRSAYSDPVGGSGEQSSTLADSSGAGPQRSKRLRDNLEETLRGWKAASRPASERCPVSGGTLYSWESEPRVGRVANGVPNRVDRLRGLGNAVVPQVAELIGKGIFQLAERISHAASGHWASDV
jgi:DNA (cytosine-5)-methyltransferase 1